jgi:hypothetical protein
MAERKGVIRGPTRFYAPDFIDLLKFVRSALCSNLCSKSEESRVLSTNCRIASLIAPKIETVRKTWGRSGEPERAQHRHIAPRVIGQAARAARRIRKRGEPVIRIIAQRNRPHAHPAKLPSLPYRSFLAITPWEPHSQIVLSAKPEMQKCKQSKDPPKISAIARLRT